MMPAIQTTGGAGPGGASNGFQARLPSTNLGKWSMWLAVAFVIAFMMNGALVAVFGQSTNAAMNEFSRTYLPYWGVAFMAVGLVSGVVGLVAILKQKERSLVTLLTIVPTLFVLMFLIGEFAFPH
ncbi:MAG: hypothetical protein FDZ75_00130 [Actinobacteria bacterium]|nr:MAG: hypothetical protein FDZ75_00130 [Actinomycetota bacterium]